MENDLLIFLLVLFVYSGPLVGHLINYFGMKWYDKHMATTKNLDIADMSNKTD